MLQKYIQYLRFIGLGKGRIFLHILIHVLDGVLYVNFPDSAVIYLRSSKTTSDELKICIHVRQKQLQYGIPILKVKNYTLEEIFEKQLWMLIPFYIFRYEKEFRKIDGNQKRLSGLRLEYEKIAEMLDQECQSGHMKPITCGALCELSNNVVEKLASKYSNVEKEVTEVMGGKVLNYRSKEIYLEGCAFGRKEGQKESIVQLVTRKYQLGDSPEKIAKDLLMSEEEVEEILGKTTGSQQ